MQIAMAVGGCTGDDADLLRRAMGSKRGVEKIERLRGRSCTTGWPSTASPASWPTTSTPGSRRSPTSGSPRATRSASRCWSTPARGSSCTTRGRSWPGCCGPSRWASTPRSRWSPTPGGTAYAVLRPDIARSGVHADLEPLVDGQPRSDRAWTAAWTASSRRSDRSRRTTPDPTPAHRRDGDFAVRLGLTEVQGIGTDAGRDGSWPSASRPPFADMNDVVRRTGLTVAADRGAGHRRGLRRLRAVPAAGAVERRVRRQRRRPCPARRSTPHRRRCPG